NILRENKALRSSTPKKKYIPSKNRFKGTVIAETANISDSQSIKKMSGEKLKSVPTQSYISNDSSLPEDDNQHKYTQTYTDTDSSLVDSIHCHKATQANIQLEELEEKNDEIVEARTDAIGEEKSNLEVANVEEENDEMKRKRKRKLQEKFNTSMVDEAHMSAKSCAPRDVDKATSSSKECEEPSVLFHLVNKNQVLVFMKHPFSLFFKGVLNITVLRGRIEVLGFVMDSCSKTQRTVFSPKGSSMVGIETCVEDPPCSEDYEQLEKSFEDLDIDLTISKALIAGIERCSCVILLEAPTQSPFENYLKTLTSEMQLFSFSKPLRSQEKTSSHCSSEVALNCVFEFDDRKSYKQTDEWEETSEKIIRSNKEDAGARTVICGGKGVGKSTFLRFLVNRHLTIFELKPERLREAMVISYFSEFLLPPTYSLTEIVPYKIILSKLILSVCHKSVPNSQILSAMDGNLVALCTYMGEDVLIPEDKEHPCVLRIQTVCPCLGFVTPLPVKDLSDVNCLMLGAVMLPDYVYTQFEAGKGLVPYVATGPGQATSKPLRPYYILKN
ncbi:hypothetical protein C0J52_25293, partial [Blattella germanica]